MKTRNLFQTVLLLSLLVLANGCTYGLWKNADMETWNEPASNPNLRLFHNSTNDFLVVYDEYHEHSGMAYTRAYWLNENQKRVAERHTPHFVSTNLVSRLTPVPVFSSPSEEINSPKPCALVETNGQSFTIYSANGEKSEHDLPFYDDGKGTTKKLLLTPLTVTADATLVGAILGWAYVGGFSSDYNPSY